MTVLSNNEALAVAIIAKLLTELGTPAIQISLKELEEAMENSIIVIQEDRLKLLYTVRLEKKPLYDNAN